MGELVLIQTNRYEKCCGEINAQVSLDGFIAVSKISTNSILNIIH